MQIPFHRVLPLSASADLLKTKTIEDLQTALLNTSILPEGQKYRRDLHFDLVWANSVLQKLYVHHHRHPPLPSLTSHCIGWCSSTPPPSPSAAPHLEEWYNVNVWSAVIDASFHSLPSMTLSRGEPTCVATALRRNRDRAATKRQRIGIRLDGIIHTISDDRYEFGGIEAA